jgi:non-heme chloroperoxidase
MLKKSLFVLIFLVILITVFIQWQVYKINAAPELVSYETFSKEPDGVEAYVTCSDGTKLRVMTGGQGSKMVVLAHGFGGTIRDWNLIFNQLVQDGYHVIAFEQRGHYKSTIGTEGVNSKAMASDYKTILEHFDVKDAVLVGHSMGGFVGIRFLLDYPEVVKQRLRGALILSSFAGDISRDNEQNKYQIPAIEKGWINRLFSNQSIAVLFQSTVIGKPYKAIVQSAIDNFKVQNYNQLIPILQAFVAENYYPRLQEIALPCTIVVGTLDKTAPAFHSETLAKNIPNARLEKIQDCGHLLTWEAPKEVCGQIEHLFK